MTIGAPEPIPQLFKNSCNARGIFETGVFPAQDQGGTRPGMQLHLPKDDPENMCRFPAFVSRASGRRKRHQSRLDRAKYNASHIMN